MEFETHNNENVEKVNSEVHLKKESSVAKEKKLANSKSLKNSSRIDELLKNHKLMHTDQKPYKCSTCGKQYHHSGYLKIHELSHKKEAEYIRKEDLR